MGHFNGKIAVITGAGSGIGRALADVLAREGARLALSDIDEGAVMATLGMLPATTDAKAYRLDVTSREAVFAHADHVIADFGTAHLLFNNAGSAMLGTFEHQTIEEIQWMVDLDLWSVVYATKAFLPVMLAQREGRIVNISSIAGLIGFPALSAYNIAKFGVRGLTESLWSELEGTGVNAVCVHPGGIRTNIERASRRCANAGPVEARADAVNAKTLRTSPERCAQDIVNGIRRGQRRIITGYRSTSVDWLARLLPDSYPALFSRVFRT
ncbi:MAG TPA: SDR family oxidoreductase [Blastocatellia bacterium]|nr:SDR family oxidoreductase [Blastocatellia bacterium]